MVRVNAQEFALIREYYQQYGNNYQLIVTMVKRRVLGAGNNARIPDNILELWRGLSDEQLRRRVRDSINRRIGV